MKVIDLLNKIANNEEVPKKVIYYGIEYIYDESDSTYYDDKDMTLLEAYNFNILNDEIEVLEEKKTLNNIRESYGLPRIEEKKIPEKLENEKEFYTYVGYKENKDEIDKVLYILKAINLTEEKIDNLTNSINFIIDHLKSKGE